MEQAPQRTRRQGDGGTYLVVADESDEFKVALQYGCYVASRNRGHVGILHVIEDQDFQQWGGVEARIKKEMRLEAEKFIWNIAKTALDYNNAVPSLYFAEGDKSHALIRTLEENEGIVQLILGAGGSGGPGPLVSYVLGKGFSQLKVPLVIVPAHMEEFS